MDPARLKADAGAALAAGHFARAASLYAAYCASAPRDRQSHLRLGDAYDARAPSDKTTDAIDAYLTAATGELLVLQRTGSHRAGLIAASKRVPRAGSAPHTQMSIA
jgi:hypothetical protein